MTNAVVTINGAPALPTLLGQGPVRIAAGGKIRAGIKVLTKKAAEHPKAKEIYDGTGLPEDLFGAVIGIPVVTFVIGMQSALRFG